MAKKEEPAWYSVTGRCAGEDEDSVGVYWGTEARVWKAHRAWLRKTQSRPKTHETFISSVVLCSRVRADKPEIIHSITR